MSRTPVLFIGHGNPMNAITDNPYRRAWTALGASLIKPRAILCVSAHWETASPQVCSAAVPETLHDFGGFPAELFAQRYPAPGAPELAARACALASETLTPNAHWGLDHGAWTVLASLFPQADVPVSQLSLGRRLSPSEHLALARQLRPLRDDGVMLVCSGNIVHNLRRLSSTADTPAWARDFDRYVSDAVEAGDEAALVQWHQAGEAAELAVPSAEHYLPLLYAIGMRHPQDSVQWATTGFDLGSLSMRSLMLSTVPAPTA